MAEHPDVRAIDYAFESGDVDSLEAKLREMLEYLPTPKAQDASPGRTIDQTGLLAQSRRRRGPKPDMARHQKIAAVVEPYGQAWKQERNLQEIARRLDQEHVGVRKSWTELEPQAVRSWKRAATSKPDLVIKAIDYSLSVVSRSPR